LKSGRHWTSTSYLALLGYPPESDAVDTPEKAGDLIHPEDREMVRVIVQRHFAAGTPYDLELRLRRADAEYRWFKMRGSAEVDSDGQPHRVSGSIYDIQKQRTAEEALREAQARFTRAIHGTQDGLWEIDLHREGLWLAPRFAQLLGYIDGELGN